MTTSTFYTEIRCLADSSLIRYEDLEGRRHLVVPVVMLIGNTIIQGANATTPELVPIECLQRSHIASFNSCPIVPYHPYDTDQKIYVSARSPHIYSEARMGVIFNTYLNDNKLGCEAWIDLARVDEIGGDAKLAVEKIESGKSIDVSVGVNFTAEKKQGKYQGDEYGLVWIEIWGDHLAFLPRSKGACNQDMGCGTPRVAEGTVQEEIRVNSNKEAIPMENKSFLSRLLSMFRPNQIYDDGVSDSDIRSLLNQATRKVEPAFDWVLDFYPETGKYVYRTYMYMGGSLDGQSNYYRRSYTLSEDGKSVTIGTDREEVRHKEGWESIAEETVQTETPAVASESKVAVATSQPTQLAIACSCGQNKEEPKVEAKTEDKKVVDKPLSLSVEEALQACPELKEIVTGYRTEQEAKKSALVATLVLAQNEYGEDDLKKMEVKDLERMGRMLAKKVEDKPVAGKVDFSVKGAKIPSTPSEVKVNENWRKLPDPWNLNKVS